MSRFQFIVSFVMGSLFALFTASVLADTATTTTTTTLQDGTVIKREIVTTTPAPKETIPSPSGYVSCFTVKAGWKQDEWIPDHQVCSYANSPEGLVWVEGYWACNKYDVAEGKCTNWDWRAAHWEKTVSVY